ncbi:MBL fold metallo-hydrolase [Roseomonas sp. GC11]|uniref:MBL fold metallo-hydrolase n=1 Tax=Roseomonas sp. GC11 TaxID=2950546 RepID=UPI00210D678A|nr:MBL fold metallo-hydrolase [Roseomonas sp. GC11]MCQ4161789.1 MBL fold metallo-hydrolase [Roseomonas sp. GC11]
MSFDRRTLFTASAAAALAPALPALAQNQAQGAAAPSPATPFQAPGFYRFRLGGRVVTVVNDGFGRRPNPAQGFVRNAEPAAVEAALRGAFMPTAHLDIPYTVTVLETPQGLVLFDTGTGGQLGATAGNIPANLRAAGLAPEQVTLIVMTHFHGDHITGLTDAEGKPVFANAEIVVPEPEWAFWMDEGEASRAPEAMKGAFANVRRRFAPYQARIRRIAPGAEVAPGIRSIATFGHTPGHTSYLLADGDAQVMILGDVTNHPTFNLENPGWHLIFDMDAPMAEATRRRLFDQVATDRVRCVGYHFPFPANGHVVKEGSGYRLVPAPWSSAI